MQALNSIQTHNPQLGLKALSLISSQEEAPPPVPPPPESYMLSLPLPSYYLIGDYIGMESCVDIKNSSAEPPENDDLMAEAAEDQRLRRRRRRCEENKREVPPPIPSLVRTENLPCYMPWVMKKYYTEDGRLIIREEKVKHQEYFLAHRENGRLTLHLVLLDHGDLEDCDEDDDDDEEDGAEPEMEENGESCNGGDGVGKVVVEESWERSGNGGGKCLSYDSVRRSSSCIAFVVL